MTTEINYAEFDPEVVELCKAINDLPGLHTDDSCCGHGRQPFRIFFSVDERYNKGLFVLARSVDNRYFKHGADWNIHLCVADCPEDPLPLAYVLESSKIGKEAYEQAKELVDSIVYHRKHKAFLKLYNLEELENKNARSS